MLVQKKIHDAFENQYCWTVQKPNEPRYQKYWFSKKLQHFFWYSGIFGTSCKTWQYQSDRPQYTYFACVLILILISLPFIPFTKWLEYLIKNCNSCQYYNDREGKVFKWMITQCILYSCSLTQWLLGQLILWPTTLGKIMGKCSIFPQIVPFLLFFFKMSKNVLILREKMDKLWGKY